MTWLDALIAIPWHQWVVMTFGTAGVVMTQIEATQRYACLPGLAGQAGWVGGLELVPAQIGMCVVSLICCAAWIWGLWRYWLVGWLNTATTPTDGAGTGLASPKGRKKPSLRLVDRSAK